MKKLLTILGLGAAFGGGVVAAGILIALGLALGIAINAVISLLLTVIAYYGAHFALGITLPFIKVWCGATAGITILNVLRRLLK